MHGTMFPADLSFGEILAQLAYGAALGNFLWNYPRLWRLTGKDGAK